MYDADDVPLPPRKRGQVKDDHKDSRFLPESRFLKDAVSFERILGEELRSVNLMGKLRIVLVKISDNIRIMQKRISYYD